MSSLAYPTIESIGALKEITAIAVDSLSAVAYTISAGKGTVMFQIVGDNQCWFGGATVDPATNRGIILLPRAILQISNATREFKVYFKCEAGLTTTIGVVEGER